MASQTQNTDDDRGQSLSAQTTEPPSLVYSSTFVMYIFLGKKIVDTADVSNIWMRMTAADLDDAYSFKKSLIQYIQSATELGMTHYYPLLGDIIIFPISFPLDGRPRNRLVLRTEPLHDGQMYFLLPETSDEDFPATPMGGQNLVQGDPLRSPCPHLEYLRLEGASDASGGQSWEDSFDRLKRLAETAAREELPAGIEPFTLVVGADPDSVENTGTGAWARERLGPLLTREFLDFASRDFESARSGVTTNGWH